MTEHMPPNHQKFLEWNGDRFRNWAKKIGSNTFEVVDRILASGEVEQQYYRSCMGLLKLAERYSKEKLEATCSKALMYSDSPSYKSISNLIRTLKPEDFNRPEPKDEEVRHHSWCEILRRTPR